MLTKERQNPMNSHFKKWASHPYIISERELKTALLQTVPINILSTFSYNYSESVINEDVCLADHPFHLSNPLNLSIGSCIQHIEFYRDQSRVKLKLKVKLKEPWTIWFMMAEGMMIAQYDINILVFLGLQSPTVVSWRRFSLLDWGS